MSSVHVYFVLPNLCDLMYEIRFCIAGFGLNTVDSLLGRPFLLFLGKKSKYFSSSIFSH